MSKAGKGAQQQINEVEYLILSVQRDRNQIPPYPSFHTIVKENDEGVAIIAVLVPGTST